MTATYDATGWRACGACVSADPGLFFPISSRWGRPAPGRGSQDSLRPVRRPRGSGDLEEDLAGEGVVARMQRR